MRQAAFGLVCVMSVFEAELTRLAAGTLTSDAASATEQAQDWNAAREQQQRRNDRMSKVRAAIRKRPAAASMDDDIPQVPAHVAEASRAVCKGQDSDGCFFFA